MKLNDVALSKKYLNTFCYKFFFSFIFFSFVFTFLCSINKIKSNKFTKIKIFHKNIKKFPKTTDF